MDTLNGMPITMLNGLGCPQCAGTCSTPARRPLGDPAVVKFNSTPTSDWTCDDWMIWHKQLVQAFQNGSFKSGIKYPKDQAIGLANQVFIQWWKDVVSWFSYNYSFCGYGSDFLNYFKSVGMTDHISAVAGTVTPIISSAPKVADSAAKVVENTAKAAENTTSVAKWLVPTIVVGGVALVGVYLYKNYAKGNKRVKVGPATV
jgi:hypothetical protein